MITSVIIIMIMLSVVVIPMTASMEKGADNRADNDTADGRLFERQTSYTATLAYDTDKFVWSDTRTAEHSGYIVTENLIAILNYNRTVVQCVWDNGTTTGQNFLNGADMSLEFSGNTWTIKVGSSTLATNSFTWAYVTVDSGGHYYTPAAAKLPAFVNPDATMVVFNESSDTAPLFVAEGTVASMDIDFQFLSSSSTFTALTAVTPVATEGTYSYSLSSAKLTQTSGPDITFTGHLLIPVEYRFGPDADPLITQLVTLVPVILIVGVIVSLSVAIIARRYEDI